MIHINGPLVFNNYVRFTAIQRFSQPGPTISFLSTTQGEMDADVCSQNLIRHAVPPQLCSSLPFSVALIRAPKLDSSAVLSFFMLFCVCAPSPPTPARAPPLALSASISQLFSVRAGSAFSLQRGADISVELCYCKAIAFGSDDVTTEQIFGHCVGMM